MLLSSRSLFTYECHLPIHAFMQQYICCPRKHMLHEEMLHQLSRCWFLLSIHIYNTIKLYLTILYATYFTSKKSYLLCFINIANYKMSPLFNIIVTICSRSPLLVRTLKCTVWSKEFNISVKFPGYFQTNILLGNSSKRSTCSFWMGTWFT